MLKISKAALLAAMLSLSAAPALSIVPAAAQEMAMPGMTAEIMVPTILAVDSSMDESALRELFTSKFLEHADDLAKLTATSITIPEIRLTMNVTEAGKTTTSTAIYKDLVLSGVKDGYAESLTVASMESTDAAGTLIYGKTTEDGFDIKRTLELVGIVAGDPSAPMKPIYKSFTIEPGSFKGPLAECSIGAITGGPGEGRPGKVAFASLLEAFESLGKVGMGEPPPAAIETVVGYVVDVVRAFRIGGSSVGPVACTGTDDKGQAIAVNLAGASLGNFEPGIYPLISVKGVAVNVTGEGAMSFDDISLKPIDFNPTLEALDAAAGQLNQAWFDLNWRKLIPSAEGFAMSGVDVDVPNPDSPGARVKAKIGSFDLSLANYLNGIPTKVSTSAVGIDVPLPQDTTDPQMAMLLAAGLDHINFGFDVGAAWNKDAKTIDVSKIAIAGVDLGSFSMATTIGNATEQLFDPNPNIAMASSLGVTVKNLTLNLTDDGFGAIAWPLAAQQEGQTDVAAYRTQMAGVAEGLALQMLGSTDAARGLGAAIGDFVTGKATALTITIVAKDPNGIALPLFMAAQNDPTVLTGLVDVTGTAQ